ncbi:MAG TPA: glycosyltransferase [Candidatus Cybelea sp.]|nr:glycosyltransferase [Candidatus Cybelea sp.]
MHFKPRVVVTGFIGLFPFGGVAWDYAQYAAGFAKLGWDVLYLEDTGSWPVYQRECEPSSNVAHVAATMEYFGLVGNWAYRDAVSGRCFGLSQTAVDEFCRTADIFLNLSCSAPLRDEYAAIPIRALVDTDPMFTQIQYVNDESLSGGPTSIRALIENHTHHFTFGNNIGDDSCRVPTLDLHWYPTRQPILLERWPLIETPAGESRCYSTVMNWNLDRDVVFGGERWGQKDVEFMRVLDLPRRIPEIRLGVAVSQAPESQFPAAAAREAGWLVFDPASCAHDAQSYQEFIVASRGEFSVAKQTYVKAQTGWFSCRSSCYLAAGRPVVTQDTSWSRRLPNGRGLLAFHDQESAIEALRHVESDPKLHAKAARSIAHDYFDSSRVLSEMLAVMGC